MKKINKLAISAVIVSLSTITHAGDIVGMVGDASSDNEITVGVGVSNVDAGPHTSGKAGIGVSHKFGGARVDLAGISRFSQTSQDNGATVYSLNDPYGPNGHQGMGNFNFIQVGTNDVWFGEWSKDGAEPGDHDDRQAYYVGNHSGTTMPSGGKASYTVYGMAYYQNQGMLKGTLNADFNTNQLNGVLESQSSDEWNLAMRANIDPTTASFKGMAIFVETAGTVKGHFFGDQASSLAGIAEFDEAALNVAFGGTKNN